MQLPEKVLYVRTQNIPDVFVGIGKAQATKYVSDMYENPEFSDGVIKPTQKTTIVSVDRFVEFLKWMDDGRFQD